MRVCVRLSVYLSYCYYKCNRSLTFIMRWQKFSENVHNINKLLNDNRNILGKVCFRKGTRENNFKYDIVTANGINSK